MPGASWPASNVSFPTVDGAEVLQLAAVHRRHGRRHQPAELLHQTQVLRGHLRRAGQVRRRAGLRHRRRPPGGDVLHHHPARRPDSTRTTARSTSSTCPTAGGASRVRIFYQTTWETYQTEPWEAVNAHAEQRQSFNGWHDLQFTVSAGHVKYFIDGAQVADHGGSYYPETTMSINFNLWFIDTAAHAGGRATYNQQVDWLYYAGSEALTPAQVTPGSPGCVRPAPRTPTRSATATARRTRRPRPPARPRRIPTNPPTQNPTNPPANCSGAPAWNWGTVYLEGQRVRHPNRQGQPHLWQANWWTQGSEPGWTAQWRDLGAC